MSQAAPAAIETQAASTDAPKPSVKLFDRSKHISPSVPHPDFPNGRKECVVRFPTDKEWCQRAHRIVQVRKNVGDGVKTENSGMEDANLELFNAIRIDKDGPEFDGAEAMMVLGRIERTEIVDTTRQGVNYAIRIKTFFGSPVIVTHTLKIPTQKQLMDFTRAAIDIVGRKQTMETRFALEPAGDLWKKVHVSHDGYSPVAVTAADPEFCDVPVIHKDVAINELMSRVNSDFEDSDPED